MIRKWYPAIVVVAALVASVAVYGRLPDRVPIHWDVNGDIDRTMPRAIGAVLGPVIALALWALLRGVPRIDPRRANYDRFGPTYDILVNSLVTLAASFHLVSLAAALGWNVRMERVAPVLVGILVLVLGNVMPRMRSSWFVGIRTPWTLSSDRVWERTHRLGGYLLTVAGLVMIGTGLFVGGASGLISLIALGGAMLAAVVFSFFAWRQETRRGAT